MAQDQIGELRRHPLQDRSTQRLDGILDTAAALIDESGYGALSPTTIARRAGISHSGIYRYFADSDAIVRALAARNLERFLTATQALLARPDLSWQDGIRQAIDLYADMYRTEPGFRWLRLGDGVDSHLLSDTDTNKRIVALAIVDFFRTRYDTWDRPDFMLRVEMLLEIVDALVSRGFHSDPDGERPFLDEARRLAVAYLEEYIAATPGTPF